MILADKIINLRKKLGISQEQLAEQLGVSRQSVSKWESMQSMPDTAKIIQLAEIFGVSTDYLLKDDIEEVEQHFLKETSKESSAIKVSLEEANAFLELNELMAKKTAIGVFFIIISSVFLIFSSHLVETYSNISEGKTIAIGLIMLFLFVSAGVSLITISSMRKKKYKYIEEEEIETAYGVDAIVKDKKEKYETKHIYRMVTGVVLCILSGVVVSAVALIKEDFAVLGVCATMIMVSIGVYYIVYTSSIMSGYKKLLQEEEYTPKSKTAEKKSQPVQSIFWLSVLGLYLGYSFITMRWDISWVIWPVAGITSGIIALIVKAVQK